MPDWLRRVLAAVLLAVAAGIGTFDVAAGSIRFDLQTIGESIYEAHKRSGNWPVSAADLEGTSYLAMPYRREMLERDRFVLVSNRELLPDRDLNAQRVLAYDNVSLLSRFGRVWVCRGDLKVEWMAARELQRILDESR